MRNTKSHHRSFDDFPVGTRVRIVCKGQDFHFFRGDETGEVVRNSGQYLGIIVRYDEPRHYVNQGWGHRPDSFYDVTEFNFEPSDLLIAGEVVGALTVRPADEWPDLKRSVFG